MKIFNYLRCFFLVALATLVMVSCEKKEPEPEVVLGTKAELKSLTFRVAENPKVNTMCTAYLIKGSYFFTVNQAADLSELTPTIEVSDGATVTLNGHQVTGGEKYDFTDTVEMTITSEDGKKKNSYYIYGRKGFPKQDAKIFKFMQDFDVPGVGLAIMKGEEIVYSAGFGFAHVTNRELCTADHLFRMASVSKQFCALSIMKLCEQGKLDLDGKVFGKGGILDGIYSNITMYHEAITPRHLLSHSSGICKGLDDPAFTTSYRMYSNNKPVPTDTLIQRTINKRQGPYNDSNGVIWEPGAAYNYSNVGFCILHRIVEVVSGKDYETFLKEEVLAPMGVTDTHIGGYENERRPNECHFYSQDGANGYRNPLRELAGAAGIITSPNQMMEVLKHIDRSDVVPDTFKKETLDMMYTPYSYAAKNTSYGSSYKNYGLGFRLNHRLFPGAHLHGGNIAGTATLQVGATNKGMSGCFFCNSRAYNSNSTGDIDDNMYVILSELFEANYF